MATPAAIYCSASTSGLRVKRPWSSKSWTMLGGIAIPLWATWPALSLKTSELPPFECLSIVFVVACVALSGTEKPRTVNTVQASWRSWIPALAFALGESGSTVFFLLATHHIAAAEANLIMYLWPGMVVGIAASLGIFRLKLLQVIGICLGFVGAAILMGGGKLSLSLEGIGLALAAGLSWSLYCVFRLRWKDETGPVLTPGFAISAILCSVLHFLLEPSVSPSLSNAAAAVAVGIIPAGLANLAWDHGFRRGDSKLLAVMAYATPLCSALFLVLFGLESFTWRLAIGAVVIVIAGLLSRVEEKNSAER